MRRNTGICLAIPIGAALVRVPVLLTATRINLAYSRESGQYFSISYMARVSCA